MFSDPAQMEPMLPTKFRAQLEASALELIRESATLSASLRSVTRADMTELLRSMNSYYSNLIEGRGTRPIDIERALRGDYATEPKKRELQLESIAHIEVQRELEQRLDADPALDIFSVDLLGWLHEQFYRRLPPELRTVTHEGRVEEITPGAIRRTNVRVGRHIAPYGTSVEAFLRRFREAYASRALSPVDRIIALAASHHRLAWIHPFPDGNGRVVRLFTHAFLKRLRLDSHGLWTASRGLARKKDEYFRFLEEADEPRRGDLDGRGALTDGGLAGFCSFFLDVCLDQARYMRELLDIDGLEMRVIGYGELSTARGELPATATHMLREVLLRGEVARGEASRITGQKERSARSVVSRLVKSGLLKSDSEKGPVRLGFPTHVVPYYFPRLYPPALEDEMMRGV